MKKLGKRHPVVHLCSLWQWKFGISFKKLFFPRKKHNQCFSRGDFLSNLFALPLLRHMWRGACSLSRALRLASLLPTQNTKQNERERVGGKKLWDNVITVPVVSCYHTSLLLGRPFHARTESWYQPETSRPSSRIKKWTQRQLACSSYFQCSESPRLMQSSNQL